MKIQGLEVEVLGRQHVEDAILGLGSYQEFRFQIRANVLQREVVLRSFTVVLFVSTLSVFEENSLDNNFSEKKHLPHLSRFEYVIQYIRIITHAHKHNHTLNHMPANVLITIPYPHAHP
jgi:hypothetical protein